MTDHDRARILVRNDSLLPRTTTSCQAVLASSESFGSNSFGDHRREGRQGYVDPCQALHGENGVSEEGVRMLDGQGVRVNVHGHSSHCFWVTADVKALKECIPCRPGGTE